jgi:ribosomal protein S18 acetylase RimI-like enzyme
MSPAPALEWSREPFLVSTDPNRIQVEAVHRFLSQSYWAAQIPREVVARALQNSLCFGLYHQDVQIGLARMITDRATFAYLCDVYVEPAWRRQGLAKWMLTCAFSHPDLQGLRRMNLVTRDAHDLYRSFGFTDLSQPGGHLEKRDPDVYKRLAAGRNSTPN